jgi:MFS family permease
LTRIRRAADRTFRSLYMRNYRLYSTGQLVSLTGTWMQSVAQAWLVLKLSGGGLALGIVTALQFLPMLLAGPWGGVIADRTDKRRLIIVTQSLSGILALALGVLSVAGVVQLWMVYLIALLLGVVNLVDMPARQAFVMEMVGPRDVANAVSLNGVVMNAARIAGPVLAGLLIATIGIGQCFLANAVSYAAVVIAFAAMRPRDLFPTERVPRGRGQLREGLRYVWSRPDLRLPLLLMAVVGALAYNFSVVFPLMVKFAFGGGPGAYGLLFAMMGAGAVVGGLVVAARGRATRPLLVGSMLAFGLMLVAAALAPGFGLELAVMVPIGAASTAFIATSNSLLQLGSSGQMRGRVMALFAVVFLGSTPIGGTLVGWFSERFGPRAGLLLGGLATVAASLVALYGLRRDGRKRRGRKGGISMVQTEPGVGEQELALRATW